MSQWTALARLNNSVTLGGDERDERLELLRDLGVQEAFPTLSLPDFLAGDTGGPLGNDPASLTLQADLGAFGPAPNSRVPPPRRALIDFLVDLSRTLQQDGDSLTDVGARRGLDDPLLPILQYLVGESNVDELRRFIDESSADAPPRLRWLQDPEPEISFAEISRRVAVEVERANGDVALRASAAISTNPRGSLIRVQDQDGNGQFAVFIETVTTVDPALAPDLGGNDVTLQDLASSPLMDPTQWPAMHGFWNSMGELIHTDPQWSTEAAAAIKEVALSGGRLIHEKVGGDDIADLLPLTLLRFDTDDRRDSVPAEPFRTRYRLVHDRVLLDELRRVDYADPQTPQPLAYDDGAIVLGYDEARELLEVRITKTLLYGKSGRFDLQTKGQTVAAWVEQSGWGGQTADFVTNCLYA